MFISPNNAVVWLKGSSFGGTGFGFAEPENLSFKKGSNEK